EAGLLKTVWGLGDCYEKLVKEFLVNIPEDCDDPMSVEFRKVFVRGKSGEFSPTVINQFLERGEDVVVEMEVTDNEVCKTITSNHVKQWPRKGMLSSVKLTVKYALLNRIGAVNWVPTSHSSDVATSLGRFIYAVGSKTKFDFSSYIFEQTVKHAKSLAVKMPIAFPTLLCSIVLSQHPGILVDGDVPCKRESPLSLHYRLYEGHVPDIVATSGKSASSKSASGSLTRKQMIADLEDSCRALDAKKLKIERVIQALKLEGTNEQAGEEDHVNADGEDVQAEDTDGSPNI
ncbi:envelope-like protein, partial [Trifolium medium]|nr:envelope-like protein [Trifolium medium]